MTFEELKLIDPVVRAVKAEGYTGPTPIQQQAIPHVLARRDLVGLAQTGTGKTAAFALPILQNLSAHPVAGKRHIRALVLSPTRELAAQIGDSFRVYGAELKLRHAVIFGGVGQGAQTQALNGGIDILVATPGRLLDLMGQGYVSLERLEVFVLDEADRMLDMGFIHDVRKVVAKLPKKRQTLLFSATMPADIEQLAQTILVDPAHVAVTPVSSTVEKIEQSVLFVDRRDKRALLRHVLSDAAVRRVLVFTRTKHGANHVAEYLNKAGIEALAIHGNKSQGARERALNGFRDGTLRVLVATDIAARGIDVEDISHVVNFDLPNVPETYVHRIGRTARAGASGAAISFCDHEERAYLADIERLIRRRVPVQENHPLAAGVARPEPTDLEPRPAPWPQQQRPQQQRPQQQRPQQQRPQSRPSGPRPQQASRPPQASRPQQAQQPRRSADEQPRRASEQPSRRPQAKPASQLLGKNEIWATRPAKAGPHGNAEPQRNSRPASRSDARAHDARGHAPRGESGRSSHAGHGAPRAPRPADHGPSSPPRGGSQTRWRPTGARKRPL